MTALRKLAQVVVALNLIFSALPIFAVVTSAEFIEDGQGESLAQTSGVFDITAYGISPNSNSDAVPAILKAAKAAIAYVKSSNRPAEIFIPTGNYFISQFELQGLNNITLHLGENAGLYAYPKSSSINASKPYITIDNCETFVFYGEAGSLLDGNGESWWSKSGSRPYLLALNNCTNYRMYGLAIHNSPFHTVVLSGCTNGTIYNLSIVSPPTSPNTDGIDPMSNIDGLEIYNCTISTGDDGFAINSVNGPMNNIYIHDCVLNNGHGMSIGSAVNYDITNVRVENLTIDGAWYAIRLKFRYTTKTAHLKNIYYNNINAKNLTKDAIAIIPNYEGKTDTHFTLEDVSINNFTCVGVPRGLSLALGSKKQAITPVVLNHVSITGTTETDQIKNCPVQVIN